MKLQLPRIVRVLSRSLYNFGKLHKGSLENPSAFWDNAAKDIIWQKPHKITLENKKSPFNKWFIGGKLNTCYNCVDRHILEGRGEQAAIIYDSPVTGIVTSITYRQLHQEICKFCTVLLEESVSQGDCIIIYMPNIIQAAVAMLSCARLGIIHSVVFGGFAAPELAKRIKDCKV